MDARTSSTPKVAHSLTRPAPEGPVCACRQEREDDVRWLAHLIRRGLKVIIAGIDEVYGESERDRGRRRVR